MALRFKNSFTRVKEEFQPIASGKVGMYTCGPTVYDFAHIGNFRAYVFEDLLRRYLKYKGYDVTQVMNLTDIDDKTIRDSRAEGIPLKEYTVRYVDAFFEDLDALGIERAEYYPAATDHIDGMVAIIQKLAENGLAYEIDGNWYFKISAFPDYGKLAHLDLSGMKAGARVATDEYEKEGKGRPGWHIECSAMSTKYLGNHFDIHTGGVDNMFPHHENEIAQTEGATGEKFVNYWLHCEYLIVDGRKMSKSLGNYYTLRQVIDKGYDPRAVRYLLMATHYRQQLNFTFAGLESSAKALERFNDFIVNLDNYPGGKSDGSAKAVVEKARSGFEDSLDDDLNISGAMGAVFDFIREINRLKAEKNLSVEERDQALELIRGFDTVLNLTAPQDIVLDHEIESLIEQRTEARKSKDFALADKIRDDLLAQGIVLEDSADGVRWKRKA